MFFLPALQILCTMPRMLSTSVHAITPQDRRITLLLLGILLTLNYYAEKIYVQQKKMYVQQKSCCNQAVKISFTNTVILKPLMISVYFLSPFVYLTSCVWQCKQEMVECTCVIVPRSAFSASSAVLCKFSFLRWMKFRQECSNIQRKYCIVCL